MSTPPSSRLDVSRSSENNHELVVLVGEIDLHTVPALTEALEVAGTDLVLDLAEVGFLDSVGLRAIVAADERLRAEGHTLVLRRPSTEARRVLEITGLADHFPLDGAG